MRTRPNNVSITSYRGAEVRAPAPNNVLITSYRGTEVRGAQMLRAFVSRTTLFIMPTLASVCSTGGRHQMVKISKRSIRKLKSYEH